MLREQGNIASADALYSGALTDALDALRTGEEALEVGALETQLAAIFQAERERVANASALAELLAPLLTNSPSSAVSSEPHVPHHGSSTPNPIAPPPPRRAARDLADFIDDMIAQERGESGSR